MITYRKLENFFDAAEDVWSVEGDSLVHKRADGTVARRQLSEVSSVRLRYAPTSYKTWRYAFEIRFKAGHAWHIDNGHFAGIADFEDRSATFAPFVREVIKLVSQHASQARAYLGSSWTSYLLQVGFLVIAFTALAGVLLVLPIGAGISGMVVVKLAIIAFFLPVVFKWARRALPQGVPINAIPDDAYPPVEGGS
jgi:hypothetical protein